MARYPKSVGRHKKMYPPEFWNVYWSEYISAEPDPISRRLGGANHQCRAMHDVFREFEYKSILFLGNGLSVVPHIYAYMGYDCKVMDISEVAINYCRTQEVEYHELAFYFNATKPAWSEEFKMIVNQGDIQLTREVIRDSRRDGGSLEFQCSNVLDVSIADESVNAVFAHGLTDYLNVDAQSELLKLIFRWLKPGGTLLIIGLGVTICSPPKTFCTGIESIAEKAGFRIFLKSAYEWSTNAIDRPWWKGAQNWNADLTDDQTDVFLDRARSAAILDYEARSKGEKLAIFGIPPDSPLLLASDNARLSVSE